MVPCRDNTHQVQHDDDGVDVNSRGGGGGSGGKIEGGNLDMQTNGGLSKHKRLFSSRMVIVIVYCLSLLRVIVRHNSCFFCVETVAHIPYVRTRKPA